MIAELIDFFLSRTPTPALLQGIVVLGALILSGLLPAITFKPTLPRFFLGLLTIVLCYVVDFILSASIVESQNLEFDRFPSNVELVLYGIITLGWVIGVATTGLLGGYHLYLRSALSKTARGAIDVLPFAGVNAGVATRLLALVFLSECALLAPNLALIAIGRGWVIGYVMIALCLLGLPFGIPAFIARGRPLGAWTFAIALNLILLPWGTQFLPAEVPTGQTQALWDVERIFLLLVNMPTLAAAPGTAARWLWIGFKRLVEMASD